MCVLEAYVHYTARIRHLGICCIGVSKSVIGSKVSSLKCVDIIFYVSSYPFSISVKGSVSCFLNSSEYPV